MRQAPALLALLALSSLLALSACCGGGGNNDNDAPVSDKGSNDNDDDNDDDKNDDDGQDDGDSKAADDDDDMAAIKTEAVKIKGDLKTSSNRYRKLLNEGRKQVRSKDYTGGIATFVEALKDDPNDPKLLGELSYAAIQAEQYDRAISAAQLCTRQRQEPRSEGACWYNLGLAWEKKGNKEKAAEAYRESLAVRPDSKPVEDRLAALDVPAPPAAEVKACGGFSCTPAPTLQALCKRLAADLSADAGADEPGTCSTAASRKVNSGDLEQVAILTAQIGNIGEEYHLLAMKDADGWRPAGTLAYVYNPGAFGIYEEATINISLKDVIPGDPVEIIADVRHNRHDSDMAGAEYEDSFVHAWHICTLRDGKPACLPAIPRAWTYDRERSDEVDAADLPPAEGLPIHQGWAFDASFPSPGKIKLTLKDVKGDVAPDIRAFSGEHDLNNLPATSFNAFFR